MTVIVALDLSLTGTGVARWQNGRPVSVTTIATTPNTHLYRRIDFIVGRIWTNLPRDPRGRITEPTMATIEARLEGASGRGSTSNALDIAELRGYVKTCLYRAGVPVAEIHPNRLKKYATGNGAATKDMMVAAADEQLPLDWPRPNDHNQADALWLLAAALDNYGQPAVVVPTVRTAVLRHTVWPIFAMEA